MNRLEAKKEIKKILAERIVNEQVFQRKPWTCYTALGKVGEKWIYRLLDFAKVIYPDKWNAEEGVRLAKRKALAYQVKLIMLWFSFHRDCPEEVCPWDAMIERWLDGTLLDEPLCQQAYMEAVAEMEERCGGITEFDGL